MTGRRSYKYQRGLIRPKNANGLTPGGLMRLVCPNCAAQYEVADAVIPTEGRSVQCSNCGQTWVQEPADADQPRKGENNVQPTVGAPKPEPEPEPKPDIDADEHPAHKQPSSAPRPPRTPHDPAILDILKREAEREKTARAHEAPTQDEATPEATDRPGTIADQPTDSPDVTGELAADAGADPGATEPGKNDHGNAGTSGEDLAERARNERRRGLAEGRLSGRPSPAPAPAPAPASEMEALAPAPKRPAASATLGAALGATPATDPEAAPDGALPDVDELNSTLLAADDKNRHHDESDRYRKRGGRFGFYLALLIFLVLLAAYGLKPQLSTAFPAAAPALDTYATMIDSARYSFADGVAAVVESIRTLLGQIL